MKILFRIVVVMLAVLLIAGGAGTLYYYNRINNDYGDHAARIFDRDPQYHFSLILNSVGDVYWQEFKEGVYEAASIYNIAIEYNLADDLDVGSKTLEYIDIAVKSKVDGIIFNGSTTIPYDQVVADAAKENIHIVLAGEEVQHRNQLSYIGTNFYEYGAQVAKLIAQAGSGSDTVNVAVILASQNSTDPVRVGTVQSDIMLSGLQSVVDQDHLINILSTKYRRSGLLGAEDLTRSILTEFQEVDVIFCMNEKDTVAAARVIVERNLVGQVVVVGTDITEEIINYINKGIIYGVVDRNGYDAGYKSVEMLRNNIRESFHLDYEDVDLDIYTKMNVSTYN